MAIQSHILIHTIKTAIATTLSALVYLIFQIPAGFWMTISCVIVMQSGIDTGSFESSLRAARDRTLGTIVGSIVGIGGAFLATFGIWWVIPGLVVVTFICVYFTSVYPFLRQAVISAVLIMLIADKGPEPWHIAFARAGSIVAGCLIAALVSLTILPYRAKDHLRMGLAKVASLFATYYRLIIEGKATLEIKEGLHLSLRQNQRVARDLGMALGLSRNRFESYYTALQLEGEVFDELKLIERSVAGARPFFEEGFLQGGGDTIAVPMMQALEALPKVITDKQKALQNVALIEEALGQLREKIEALRHYKEPKGDLTLPLDQSADLFAFIYGNGHLATLVREVEKVSLLLE